MANYLDGTLNIFFGFGNGSFAAPMVSFIGREPSSLAIDDLNKDGWMDIIVSNYADNNISVLIGYGNGSFSKQTIDSFGQHPISVEIGDFNNDTNLGIACINQASDNLVLFFGYGNGTFAIGTPIELGNGSSPYSMTVDDMNKDALVDVVIANQGSNDVRVLFSDGNGTFTRTLSYAVAFGPYPISLATAKDKDYPLQGIGMTKYIVNQIDIVAVICCS